MMKKILTVFALATFTTLLSVPAVISAEKSVPVSVQTELKNFPRVAPEAVYKNVEKIYRFSEDGSCDVRTKIELRINTLFAMNELCGETFIIYNPKFQHVKVNTAYTLMADGKTRVDLPENALNEVLPKAAENAPAFNFLRELVITHTALEPGATIFLDYTIHYRTSDSLTFDEYPNMPFSCERLFFDFNGATTELFNVPARSRETHFTPQKSVPVIYPGMKAVKQIDYDKIKTSLNAASNKIVQGLVNSLMTESEKVWTLQKFVAEKIATAPIQTELLNFELRSQDEVLASAYGVPAEKALLLKAMIEQLGLKKSKFCKPEIVEENKKFFVCSSGKTVVLPIASGEFLQGQGEKISISSAVKISQNKEVWTGTLAFNPISATEADMRSRAATVVGFAEKDFIFIGENNANSANFTFSGTRNFEPTGGIYIWTPPADKKGLKSSGFDKLPSTRLVTLEVGKFISEEYNYVLELDAGVRFLQVPISKEIENAAGKCIVSIRQDGNKIVFKKMIYAAPNGVIETKNYQAFRELMNAWFSPESNRVLLEIKNP